MNISFSMPSAATDATGAATLNSLLLPRATFAKLSPTPYLTAHLQPLDPSLPPIRPDGRSSTTFRIPTCTTGSLTHCFGSAVVRLGDTAVVCGIQAEILLASAIPNPPRNATDPETLAALNILVPNVDLATGCSPAHLPGAGGPPSSEAQTLSQRLLALLLSSKLIDLEDLRIKHTPKLSENNEEGEAPQEQTVAYWTLYISVHVLSLSGSRSLFDAAWAALIAALRNTRLPSAWWDPDLESVVCSDQVSQARSLNLRGQPVAATWAIFITSKSQANPSTTSGGHELGDGRCAWTLADPDGFEDPLCQESVTVVVDCSNGSRLLKIEKHGGTVVGKEMMTSLVQAAQGRWKQWIAILPSLN